MNIVTIKAKARLAAMKLHNAKECSTDDIAAMLEQVFTPDSANEANMAADLVQALGLLKQAKSIVPKHYVVWHDNASTVLAKYPNLKRS